MPKKKLPKASQIPLSEAYTSVGDVEETLAALKAGDLIAYGRQCFDPFDSKKGKRYQISAETWEDFRFSGECLGGVDETVKDDELNGTAGESCEVEWRDITIDRDSLERFTQGDKNPKNAGRKPKYDWDQIWREIVYDFYENGKPESIEQWITRLLEDLERKYLWGNDRDDEIGRTSLQTKLSPLFHALAKDDRNQLKEAYLLLRD